MPNLLVKNHVVDPQTGETYLRGTHKVDEVVAYSLTSNHPEDVVEAESLASENKEELVNTARAAGVEVDASDTKSDVAKKLGTKSK